MNRLWRMMAPITLGVVALTVMLSLIATTWTEATAAEAIALVPSASVGLPEERAELYRQTLLNSLRTQPYLHRPQERTVIQEVRPRLGPNPSEGEVQAAVEEYYANFHYQNEKHSRANPLAIIGRMKAQEMASMAGNDSAAAVTGNPEVLTVMVNFTGVETYTTSDPVAFQGSCLTDTTVFSPSFQVVVDGPRFNEIPQPIDNFLPWLDPATSPTGGFTKEYFDLLMFSTTGDTSIMRPELPNPWDGGNGFDYSGVSFRNYFVENSRGTYIPQGEVIEVSVPEAVSYFGAARCNEPIYDDAFHGRPIYTIAISTAQEINLQYPGAATASNGDFRWADWDKEDVADFDNDGNFNEPDGYVDHFFLIEAGISEGGPLGEFMIWPHSTDVNLSAPGVGPAGNQLGGYQVATDGAHPLGSVWILNYTISDETGGLGVLAHEYGHDIGLPDNYGIDGSGPNPGYWDVMDAGTFGGGLLGMQPVHMNIWDKEFLGWNDPVEIDLAQTSTLGEENAATFVIGQQSKPPVGTIDGLRIDLPEITTFASVEPFGTKMWWSDQADDRNESIARELTVAAGESIAVRAQMAYFIEEDYDYAYWEIFSTVTGEWVPLEIYSGTTLLTTNEDPNGGNPSGNGLNGFSPTEDWIEATATITPGMHAGGTITFRFRYVTDTGFQEEGIYLDNISFTGSTSGLIFSDDAEGGDLWTHTSDGLNSSTPWKLTDGSESFSQYYLVEWRNSGEETGAHGTSDTATAFEIAGFDIGLNRVYWFNRAGASNDDSTIEPFSVHTPGMLVWYINNAYENNTLTTSLEDPPSVGAKGRMLLVDANPNPYFVDDAVAGQRILTERLSAFDGAFTLDARPSFTLSSDLGFTGVLSVTTIPGQEGKTAFHDRIGAAPGITGESSNAFYIDANAGVVLPTVNNVPYWPAWDFYGLSGNPGLEAFGINLEVIDQAEDGTWGEVRFWLDDDTVFFKKKASVASATVGQVVTYTLTLKDASGNRFEDGVSYTFPATMTDQLPANVTYVPGSLTITDGPWTTTPSTATISGNLLTWSGILGGNPLDTPDAVIEYAVTVNVGSGALVNSAMLQVEQQLISTDTFSETLAVPYMWPRHERYFASTQVTVGAGPTYYFPAIRLRD